MTPEESISLKRTEKAIEIKRISKILPLKTKKWEGKKL